MLVDALELGKDGLVQSIWFNELASKGSVFHERLTTRIQRKFLEMFSFFFLFTYFRYLPPTLSLIYHYSKNLPPYRFYTFTWVYFFFIHLLFYKFIAPFFPFSWRCLNPFDKAEFLNLQLNLKSLNWFFFVVIWFK